MILQSKISKTKKRLSEDSWYQRVIVVAFFGLSVPLASSLRAVSAAGSYGIVTAEIPVIHVPAKDPTFQPAKPAENISKRTPVLPLTDEEFLFGDVEAFSARITDVRNKFSIKHQDGAPRLDKLFATLARWQGEAKGKHDDFIVFLPADNIPAPIVVQVIEELKKASLFQRVVLAGGLL